MVARAIKERNKENKGGLKHGLCVMNSPDVSLYTWLLLKNCNTIFKKKNYNTIVLLSLNLGLLAKNISVEHNYASHFRR
jgi:hypothetical protein